MVGCVDFFRFIQLFLPFNSWFIIILNYVLKSSIPTTALFSSTANRKSIIHFSSSHSDHILCNSIAFKFTIMDCHAWATRGRRRTVISVCFLLVFSAGRHGVHGSGVFRVQHKFSGVGHGLLERMKAHDARRHGRVLSVVDLPLFGNGSPSDAGLYYAQIEVGTPPKKFHVQVDTGSDILWINCKGCKKCPVDSDLNIELTFYDPNESKSSVSVTCDQPFCTSEYHGTSLDCTNGSLCPYHVPYGDGSTTTGFYVNDLLQYEQPSDSSQPKKANASIIFGCAAYQSGDLSATRGAIDGILGFGQSNSSMLSQLASSGNVKKMFAHCLDSVRGGGIFAIGNVVHPTVQSVSLMPDMPHYTIHLKGVVVGNSTLSLSDPSTADNSGRAIIDSGTTLAYLPDGIYNQLMKLVTSSLPNIELHLYQGFQCFGFIGSIDEQFPTVTLLFEKEISLKVYPHNYLFPIQNDGWCIGWQSSTLQTRDELDISLLGDFVLSDKLIVYDLEKQIIGWTDYNCSSSIKIQDEKTSQLYNIEANDISSVGNLQVSFHVKGMWVLTSILFFLQVYLLR